MRNAFLSGDPPLRVIGITRSSNDIVITYDATAARSYRLERKLALTGPTPITDPGAVSLGKAFYRVRLLP